MTKCRDILENKRDYFNKNYCPQRPSDIKYWCKLVQHIHIYISALFTQIYMQHVAHVTN